MPYKDPEKNRECIKEYYEKNKEHIKNYKKEWSKEHYENNKEHIKKTNKEWYEKNKEYKKKYDKEYKQTEAGKKSYRITSWKQSGVVYDDWDELYDLYISIWNCEECDVELVEGMYGNNKKCLDHDHETGDFRNILCNACNLKRG